MNTPPLSGHFLITPSSADSTRKRGEIVQPQNNNTHTLMNRYTCMHKDIFYELFLGWAGI